MKLGNLFSITASAALLLQVGTFVEANPMFVQLPPQHVDDASTSDVCQDVRITYPAARDDANDAITFTNNTKHVISWQTPSGAFEKVNITLVNDGDSSKVFYLGEFDASKGATNETNFAVEQAGTYHVNLATVGGSAPCQISSTKFEIQESSPDAHINKDDMDEAVKAVKSSATQLHDNDEHWDEALAEIDGYLKKHGGDHVNEEPKDDHDGSPQKSSKDDYPDFEKFIQDLNMDHRKYLDNNAATVEEAVTHKNSVDATSVDASEQHQDADQYFTNKDMRTHADKHLNAELDQLLGADGKSTGAASHGNDSHATSSDAHPQVDKHLNAELDKLLSSGSKSASAADHDNDAHAQIDKHLNADLDALAKERHDNAPLFSDSGSNGIKPPTMNAAASTGDSEWTMEELPAPLKQWSEESSDIPNHSNEGAWIAEEVDPSASTVHSDRSDWANVPPSDGKPFDHSNLASWQAEEVDVTPEQPQVDTTHVDVAAGTWVEGDGAASYALPDHSNVGQWEANEVDMDSESWQAASDNGHGNEVVNGWTAESSDHHPNAADGEWIGDNDKHTDASEPGWTGDDTAEHRDAVQQDGWVVESSNHPNALEPEWTADNTAEHPDAVQQDGWVVESSNHPNKAQDEGWAAEVSAHPNVAQSGWTEGTGGNGDTHANVAASGWTEN